VTAAKVGRSEVAGIDVARAQNEQAARGLAPVVEIDDVAGGEIERATRRERVDSARPRRRLAPIPLVGRGDGHGKAAAAIRSGDFDTARRLSRNGTVELGWVLARRRQDLHRLEPVAKGDRCCAAEHWREVPVQSEPGHFGAVTVVVVSAPVRLTRVTILGHERGL
jgi:hypothetical protein